MLDAIKRWRRKTNAAHERVEPPGAHADAIDHVLPGTESGELAPPELEEAEQKRLYEIIREIGYVE